MRRMTTADVQKAQESHKKLEREIQKEVKKVLAPLIERTRELLKQKGVI